tara:strand:+ start:1390 stop:2103 length:714 start_codon:yes stop_codon:yes gene_type:complete
MIKLGVNLDHVATLRQQRHTQYPSMLDAVKIVEENGADSITMHLREDRRHIQYEDVELARKNIKTLLNLEMAPTEKMCDIAVRIKPDYVCLVPEKREELTTEGGLDIKNNNSKIRSMIDSLKNNSIVVSLFIEPDIQTIDIAKSIGTDAIEIHTGRYAENYDAEKYFELQKIKDAIEYGNNLSLVVNAGHGLDYNNVTDIALIPGLNELNIGHSIVSESVFVGLGSAVKRMKELINK